MTGVPAIVANGLSVAYGTRIALREADFRVPAGAVTAVIGPNGSGKSTLLHAVVGLVEPRSGTLEVLGTTPHAARSRTAYVFQSTTANDLLPVTVGEVVAMGRYVRGGWFGRLTRADRQAVDEALERLGVADLRLRHLRELSGGQRQRVFVAQGLAQDAELLLLDEPVTGLDLVSHEQIDTVVEEEVERGKTVLLTTHDIDEARRAQHVLLLGGRVVREGSPEVLTDAALVEAYGTQLLHVEERLTLDDPHHHPRLHGDSGSAPGRGTRRRRPR